MAAAGHATLRLMYDPGNGVLITAWCCSAGKHSMPKPAPRELAAANPSAMPGAIVLLSAPAQHASKPAARYGIQKKAPKTSVAASAGHSPEFARGRPHRKVVNDCADSDQQGTPQPRWRKAGNQHRTIAKTCHSAEGNIARRNEQVEYHVQPDETALNHKACGDTAQCGPGKQTRAKLDSGTRRRNC